MIEFTPAIPVFRILDETEARAFYLDFLGCHMDWEHRFRPGAPLYCQVSRSVFKLHLSGHPGESMAGSTALVYVKDVVALQQELAGKNYRDSSPVIEDEEWGRECTVVDPFYNEIRFLEAKR